MKKEYRIDGMMCSHCRQHVEKALNTLGGVQASVTLSPAIATIEFAGDVLPLEDLQRVLGESGDYTIHED